MTSENTQEEVKTNEEEVKTIPLKVKNPKRVAAGKKAIEAKKMKAELRRKETEKLKKENIKLKQITKDVSDNEDDDGTEINEIKVNKNYIPLCLTIIGVVGVGLYFVNKKKKEPEVVPKEKVIFKKKEIDPFEFQ